MTATETVDETVETAPPEPIHWLGMAPVFVATEENADTILEQVQELGYQVFYLLGETKSTKTSQQKGKHGGTYQTTNVVRRPRLLKVVNNLIGNAVSVMDEAAIPGLGEVEAEAYFTLPAIPIELIADIDDFFREVYRLHGTEAVILFTYDPSYQESDNPSDGWGVLVPEQNNTAASCDYDPVSVVDEKPDEVYIVGSAHSHPGMAAYCSGTDKADQAQFDGIHITYGWRTGSNETEYYAELQMGGGAFVMDIEDILTEVPEIENDTIKPWTEKVKKKTLVTASYGYSGYSGTGYSGSGGLNFKDKYKYLPKNCPTPSEVTLVVQTLLKKDELDDCPCCGVELKEADFKKARCSNCLVFVQWDGMGWQDLLDLRQSQSYGSKELIPEEEPFKAIWIWEEQIKGGKVVDEVRQLYSPPSKTASAGSSAGKAKGGSVYEEYFDDAPAFKGYMICSACLERNDADDWNCWVCEAPLTMQDYHYPGEEENAKLFEEIDKILDKSEEEGGIFDKDSYIDIDEVAGVEWCLTCMNVELHCQCATPAEAISFSEVQEAVMQAGVDPYQETSMCETCVLFFSSGCKPYREWLAHWNENGPGDYEKLSGCDDYRRD